MLKRFAQMVAPAVLLALAVTARADDAAQAAQPFARASIASIDRVKQAITDLGIPLPMDPVQVIEGQFPFIGAGGLDLSKPLGIVFVAGKDFTPPQTILFAFPVNAGKATIEALTAMGGTAVAGQADAVDMGGKATIRRTADYILMYPGAAGILKLVANAPFADDFKSKDAIARVQLDLKTFRTASPDLYKNIMAGIRARTAEMNKQDAKTDADIKGENLGSEMFFSAIDKLDQISLGLDMNEKNLRLATTFTPSPMKGSREFPKPVFGPSTLMTADVVYPTTDATQWLTTAAKMGLTSDHAAHPDKLTAEQFAQEEQAVEAMTSAAAGDAQSVAFESKDGHFIVTIVNQYARDVDLPAIIKKNGAILNALPDTSKTKGMTITDTTGADGYAGIRLKSGDDPHIVTVLQKGHIAVITVSDQEIPAATRFTLSPTEKISDVLALKVDLAAALKAAGEAKGNPVAAMPEDARKALLDKLTGKSLSLTMTNDAAGAMSVSLDIPVDFIKSGVAMAMQQAMGQ